MRAVAQQASTQQAFTHRPISATAKVALVRGVATPSRRIVATARPLWSAPPHAGDAIRYDVADFANSGPAQATLVGVGQQTTNLTVQSFTAECTPLPCYVSYPAAGGAKPQLMVAAPPSGRAALVSGAAQRRRPAGPRHRDDRRARRLRRHRGGPDSDAQGRTLGAAGAGERRDGCAAAIAAASPTTATTTTTTTHHPPPPPPPPPGAQLSVTADLTPAGPYQSGQQVLLVIDVTNVGGSPADRVRVANASKNLRADKLWGGCETAPCPAFTLAALDQRQITVPATIVDADAAIDDTVTVSAAGLPSQRIPVHVAAPTPPPPPTLWIALRGARGRARSGLDRPRQAGGPASVAAGCS